MVVGYRLEWAMRSVKAILFLLLMPALLAGCQMQRAVPDSLRGQVDVFGVELFSPVDYREIAGVAATEEPCLRGYERIFDRFDLSVGYGFDKRVRKITTRNPRTSMFGVKPGMAFEEGRDMLLRSGFSLHATPSSFKSDGYSVKLLLDASNTIFGITLESLD